MSDTTRKLAQILKIPGVKQEWHAFQYQSFGQSTGLCWPLTGLSFKHYSSREAPSLVPTEQTYLVYFLSSSCESCAPAQGGDLGVIHVDKPDNPTSPDGFRRQPLSPCSLLSSLSSYQRARILTLNMDLKVKVTQPHRL